jgi:universal stress protein A
MVQFRRIVVGYNFSPDGEHALQAATNLAEREGATLALVHVVDPIPFTYGSRCLPTSSRSLLVEAASRMRTELTAVAEHRLPRTLPVTIDVPTGRPFVTLIRSCRSSHGDLIIVGGYPEPALGCTSLALVRAAPVSVLVAKQALTSSPKTILVPTDFSACSKRAALTALHLVQRFGGRVVFLHVLDTHLFYHAHYRTKLEIPTLSAEDVEPEWQTFLDDLPVHDLAWEKRTQTGWAAETISALATDLGAELIVMGTHGQTTHSELTGLTHTLLGSVAETALQQASVSVLTVRPEAFQFEMP